MSTHTFLVLYHIIGCIHGNPHSSKNLAVRGETFVCEHRGTVNSLLTDGSKNKWNYSIVIRRCNETDTFGILIKIQKVHSVGYVVVYFGDCKECDTLFNNFEVRIAVLPMDESTFCGHFDGIKHEPGQPLRVNCKATHYENPIGYVGIRPNKGGNKGAISEVEVFALEYSQEIAYYGCFIDFEADKSFDFEYNNCKVVCLKIRKRFMSLMRNGTCLCGSKVPKIELPEEICLEIVCNTTSILCAVEAIYPLYIAMMPQIFYVGCYSGNSLESDLDTESNDTFIENMTPIKCLALCANRTMMYAYLKAESKCGCKFEIAERKISEQLCSRSCSGTELVHCGGPNGEANVYSGLWVDSQMNIALKRPIHLSCNSAVVHDSLINDGNIDPAMFVEVLNDCKSDGLIGVSVLLKPHSKNIGYVTLYSGDCNDCDDLMDNFNVVLLIDPSSSNNYTRTDFKNCGQLSGRYLGSKFPNKVNCDLNVSYNDEVRMVMVKPNGRQLKISKMSTISEIEIRELEYSNSPAYYGCYEEFIAEIDLTDRTGLPCKLRCAMRGDRFMSMTTDGICRCGSTVPTKLNLNNPSCLNACKNDICSNITNHAVYIAKPPHIFSVGCYKLKESKLTSTAMDNSNLSLIHCIKKCSERGLKYAYKKFSTCHCKNTLTDQLPAHLCNDNCKGHECLETALVYSGCIDTESQSPCQDVYKCKDDNFDEFGKCLGQCEDGWYGQYCITREIPSSSIIPRPKPRIRRSKLDIEQSQSNVSGVLHKKREILKVGKQQAKSAISPECQKFIREFLRARRDQLKATYGTSDRDCLRAMEETSRIKHNLSIQTVVIVILISTVVFTAIGLASGLMYAKLMKGELMMSDTEVMESN